MLAPGLSLGNSFPLAFLDDGPLELGYRSDDLKLQRLEGIFLATEEQPFLVELDRHSPPDKVFEDGQQVVEVAGQPVNGVDVQRVTLPQEPEALLQLGPFRGGCAGLLGEGLVQGHAVKLTVGVLVQGAYADVADVGHASCPPVRVELHKV